MPTTLVMLTIRPQRRLIMPRAACFVTKNAPFKLMSRTVSQSSSPIRNSRLSRVVPALFTSTSTRPKSRSTAATTVSTCPASATSQAYPWPVPSPSALAVSWARPPSRARTATRAPARANVCAIAWPIPRVPPVTMATFPVRSIFIPTAPIADCGLWIADSRLGVRCAKSAVRNPQSAIDSSRLQELRHLIGRPQRDHARPRHDTPQQPGENVARTDFDEAGGLARIRELGRALHAGHPADRRGELVGEQAARAGGVAYGLRGRVRDDRKRRIAERRVLERHAQLIGRRGHERGMKRATHLERDHPF